LVTASNATNITFSSGSTVVGTLQFNPGAPAYSFGILATALTLTGTGIINNSSNIPTFSISDGEFAFENSSTAGNATITAGENRLLCCGGSAE
jgi:hypothetical protein